MPIAVHVACTEAEARPLRPVVLRAFEEERARSWPFLSDVLEGALRDLGEAERAIAAAAVQALVKYDRLLGFACGSDDAGKRLDALFAIASGATDPAPRIARIERPIERLGVTYSAPDWLVELLIADAARLASPSEAAAERALAQMNELAPRVLRVNTLRTTRQACLDALAAEGVDASPAKHAAQGVVVAGRRSVFRTEAFARGDVEVQDEASQLVAELVAPPPQSFVVDACAGAGGKTLAIAALLGGKGKLVALDTSGDKLDELRRRARRAGASNVQAIAADLREEGGPLAPMQGRASRVLVDAPCTGLGAVRRNPEARWRLAPGDVARLAATQRELLDAAVRLLATNGRLIYATCSPLPSEGERPVASLLERRPELSLVTARDVLGRRRTERVATADGAYLRTWRLDGTPDGASEGMDGFVAGVVRRRP